LKSHTTQEVSVEAEEHSTGFQTILADIVPPSLVLSSAGWRDVECLNDDLHRVGSIAGCYFSLHRIKRERNKWVVIYYARENHGMGEAVAELRLVVGELFLKADSSSAFGMRAELTSYMPARTKPLVYGKLAPCAKLEIIILKEEKESVFESGCDVDGDYVRASCRQTTNQSALWIRKSTVGKRHYLMIQPNRNRTGQDTAAITSSLDHDELSALEAELPQHWDPSDASAGKTESLVSSLDAARQHGVQDPSVYSCRQWRIRVR